MHIEPKKNIMLFLQHTSVKYGVRFQQHCNIQSEEESKLYKVLMWRNSLERCVEHIEILKGSGGSLVQHLHHHVAELARRPCPCGAASSPTTGPRPCLSCLGTTLPWPHAWNISMIGISAIRVLGEKLKLELKGIMMLRVVMYTQSNLIKYFIIK